MEYIVEVRGVSIGTGIPKICVPIVGRTRDEVCSTAKDLLDVPCDVAEWRVDWYEDVHVFSKVRETLESLRDILGEKPVLFTFRSKAEGGEGELERENYSALIKEAAHTGLVDLVDVEIFVGDEVVNEIIRSAHQTNVKVIASSHDFDKTPEQEELIRRMKKMQEMGADILKIAVMPKSRKDVLTLLSATEEMTGRYAKAPVVTMSMGSMGQISRVCGESFGSAMTFGTAGRASAPGQMDAGDLSVALRLLHTV